MSDILKRVIIGAGIGLAVGLIISWGSNKIPSLKSLLDGYEYLSYDARMKYKVADVELGSTIEDIVIIYENYGFETEVLVASVRTKQHVIDAALIGAQVATLPPKMIHELYNHELTDKGLKAFLDDWAKTGQSILPK